MVKKKKEFPVTNDIVYPEEKEAPMETVQTPTDPAKFTETSYGITRRRLDQGTPNDRVRTYLVEVKYNPETGETLPALITEMEDIATAHREFKVRAAKNVLKV